MMALMRTQPGERMVKRKRGWGGPQAKRKHEHSRNMVSSKDRKRFSIILRWTLLVAQPLSISPPSLLAEGQLWTWTHSCTHVPNATQPNNDPTLYLYHTDPDLWRLYFPASCINHWFDPWEVLGEDRKCYGLECSPQNSDVEALPPSVIVSGDKALR